jgi:hypothetical protein
MLRETLSRFRAPASTDVLTLEIGMEQVESHLHAAGVWVWLSCASYEWVCTQIKGHPALRLRTLV